MQAEGIQMLPMAGVAGEIGPLVFRSLSWDGPSTTAEAAPAAAAVPVSNVDSSRAIETAREEGRREAAATLQADMERRVHAERENVSSALQGFLTEKKKYFADLEKEVVRLALAIAERVLNRETAMDPTLLAGAARVLLEQVGAESAATLLVSPGDSAQWAAAIASLGREVGVREEASLERGVCLLQTESGSFELGVKAQLCEIERGFFELLARSPALAA